VAPDGGKHLKIENCVLNIFLRLDLKALRVLILMQKGRHSTSTEHFLPFTETNEANTYPGCNFTSSSDRNTDRKILLKIFYID
jgi:hypothetical protein